MIDRFHEDTIAKLMSEELSMNAIRSLGNVQAEIYQPRSQGSRAVQLGMKEEDDMKVRAYGASAIRLVGVQLEVPNETIVYAQSIFQRFFFK